MGMAMTVLGLLALQAQPPAQALASDQAGRGTVTVEFAGDDATPPAVREVFAGVVEQSLLSAGFVVLPAPGRGRYVARIKLSRNAVGQVSTGTDHGPSARLSGAGVAIALPSGGQQMHDLTATELDIDLTERSTSALAWSGKAKTVQIDGTAAGSPQVMAAKLANAMLAAFPTSYAEPIAVP